MRKVIITKGAYGHKPVGASRVSTVTRADGPIELPVAEAERIVALGVAEYVKEVVATSSEVDTEDSTGVNTPADNGTAEGKLEDNSTPVYNADMKQTELRAALDAAGIPFKFGMSKADMAEALNALAAGYTDDDTEDEDDGEPPPELQADDPVE